MVKPQSILCRRLQYIATALLALAVWQAFAEENDPARPAPDEATRARTESTDPNASKPKPETPAERTARLTKLLRYEINGDTRRILDTTFRYPKDVAQLETDFDKCLDEERYADGEKVAAELVRLLREQSSKQAVAVEGGSVFLKTDHALLHAWQHESALCQGAAKGTYGTGDNRRRSIGLARLLLVRGICTDLTRNEPVDPSKPDAAPVSGGNEAASNPFGAASSPFGGSLVGKPKDSLLYLLLRALKSEERQPVGLDDDLTQTVNLVLDRVTIKLPTPQHAMGEGSPIKPLNVEFRLTALRDVPDDALLTHDLGTIPDEQSFVIGKLLAKTPIHRSQLGTQLAGEMAHQKARDEATQKRVHSTLQRLFPSESIEVHVVRGTPILRALLKIEAHEQQIVSVTTVLCERIVLNQMTVKSDIADRVAPIAEKLEPIGDDTHGLREVLARLYPKEHIEAHVLPAHSSVVLRGHLSQPEFAQQIYDIAHTSYQTVLYQMTPPLPTKLATGKPGQTKATTPRASSSDGGLKDDASNPVEMVMRLAHVSADAAARELQPKFSGKAVFVADVQTNSLIMSAEPVVLNEIQAEVRAAVQAFDVKGAQGVASTAPTDAQETAMDREARQLATKIRTAKPDEQRALRQQLEQLTERHFDQRQQRRQREIDDLAHRLDKLRVTHHRRQENKAAVLQQRVQDLLDPNADLRWDEPRTDEVSKTDDSIRTP